MEFWLLGATSDKKEEGSTGNNGSTIELRIMRAGRTCALPMFRDQSTVNEAERLWR